MHSSFENVSESTAIPIRPSSQPQCRTLSPSFSSLVCGFRVRCRRKSLPFREQNRTALGKLQLAALRTRKFARAEISAFTAFFFLLSEIDFLADERATKRLLWAQLISASLAFPRARTSHCFTAARTSPHFALTQTSNHFPL